ncbi:kinase inhibitor [Mesobacillus campisalis]|uniref:Kinase inhibitor n=1 Tax=Mesobacillus campisalis TaxID=1408103 RepID=A0A0M2SRJ0_9BACI|nr:5-oxoprolinase subunit PxpB [Mesobacillus campisalis]KKK37199.1 kinase inhibitor [Mesobacillus campisalis]
MEYSIQPLGDHAAIIELAKDPSPEVLNTISMVASALDAISPEWMIEYVPAFTTISVFYRPEKLPRAEPASPYDMVCSYLHSMLHNIKADSPSPPRVVEIPVCYGGKFGPDLPFVASYNGISEEEVVQIHSNGEYLVYMLGFAPGFPYIWGMPKVIAAPRKDSPRQQIPERSIGIAGQQTGIYSIKTPGGWRLIGRTPVDLFVPEKSPPTLLKPGDKIKFKAIGHDEYLEMRRLNHAEHS